MKIKISEIFSNTPGGRYKDEGEYSGQEFRDDFLLPAIRTCQENKDTLTIDFDDCFGFATSFLEEAFGGLVREYGIKNVLGSIDIVANDDETIPMLVRKYITDAEQNEKRRRGINK